MVKVQECDRNIRMILVASAVYKFYKESNGREWGTPKYATQKAEA